MLIRLKKIDRKEESIMFNFPYEESEISNVYNQLELETSTAPNCYIDGVVYDSDMNIDELNFLFKRMDSFDAKERKVFFASAFAEDPKTIAKLINLSFNTHCYSLVSDFNNLETVGKDLYLSEKQAVAVKELDELDGESFAMGVIKDNSNSTITPYGVLYKNSNEPEQIYNGKQFPPYHWEETVATIQLTAKGANEFIYLPCSDVEIEKALMRLETPYLHDCEVTIVSHNFSDRIINIISADTTPLIKIDSLNVAVLTLNDELTPKELEKIKVNITGQASDGWSEGFEQREISTEMGDIYVSFWNSDNWFIKTAEEMGIEENQKMGGMKFE